MSTSVAAHSEVFAMNGCEPIQEYFKYSNMLVTTTKCLFQTRSTLINDVSVHTLQRSLVYCHSIQVKTDKNSCEENFVSHCSTITAIQS